MDYDALREVMMDALSDAENRVWAAWLEQKGLSDEDVTTEVQQEWQADVQKKEILIDCLQEYISDFENL